MKVGFVGWRGMVGSVLMQRMQEENLISVRRLKHYWTRTTLPSWLKWTSS